MNKFLFAVPALIAVTACSGGSGGGDNGGSTNGTAATVLRTFQDDAGVVRVESTEDGQRVRLLAMTPEAQLVADELRSGEPSDVDVSLEGEQFLESNEYGDFYAGTLVVNGERLNGIAYEDSDYPVAIAYLENSQANILFTGGEAPKNLPTGTYLYRGTNVIGMRDGSYMEDGTFTMEVDFTNRSADLIGTTQNTTVTGSGMNVNTNNGTFSSDRVAIDLNGQIVDGNIYGSFHGDGAEGVTGIYHDGNSNPDVAGAIAGNR